MSNKNKIETLIAYTIKNADKSYFFENYTKQAIAVMKSLENAGYQIVPVDPSLYMAKAGVEAITIGKNKPQEMSAAIWRAMLMASTKDE
jgi:hypothetical protein